MSRLRMVLLFGIAAVLLCGITFAGEFYVDAEAGNDSNTGTSPDDAWLTISHALSSVFGSQRDPATIHVAAGTYSASTNGETFPVEMKSYVSLVGAGADTTILDAEGDAFHVIFASSVREVGIESLTIKGGVADGYEVDSTGGGILCQYVSGLTMRSCTLTDNLGAVGGGVVLAQTSGLIEDCDFVANTVQGGPETDGGCAAGGVLCALSDVRFQNCTISENQALPGTGAYPYAMGAGVCVLDFTGRSSSERGSFHTVDAATVTLVGCSVLNNICMGDYSLGGGIVCLAESIVSEPAIMDCTISGNSAWSGAGIYCEGSAAAMTNCDIAQNICTLSPYETSWGGGVDIVGCSPTIRDCTVSDNSAWSGAGICCESGSAPLIEGCIIADNMGQDDSDQTSYGGGLDCGESSPTIRNCVFQRNCAYSGAGVYISTSHGGLDNCIVADNIGTPDANGQSWGGGMYALESSTSIISCTISGNSAFAGAGLRCKGFPSCAIVECTIADNIANLNVDGSSYGGGIHCYESSPTIDGCTIANNAAHKGAGLRCSAESSPTILNCHVANNEAIPNSMGRSWGGGVYSYQSSPTVDGCTVEENSAWSGSGVYCEESSALIDDCTVARNVASPASDDRSFGGGISCYSSSDTIVSCSVTENAACIGSGVDCEESSVLIDDCTIARNVASPTSDGRSWGGGICCYNSSDTIVSCSVSENSACVGAGLQIERSCGEVHDCSIANNVCVPNTDDSCLGGAINIYGGSPTISGCIVSGNTATSGPGICCAEATGLIQNCAITGNIGLSNLESRSWGGGMECFDSEITVRSCVVSDNSASYGAGIFCQGLPVTIDNCLIERNAGILDCDGISDGGGVACWESSPLILNCTISLNSAVRGGGIRCDEYSSPTVIGSILWRNGVDIDLDEASEIAVLHSCVENGYSGTGNISDDPLFVSGPLGDYYLSCEAAGQGETSPCIDAGSDTAEALGLDELTTRTDCGPDTGVVDMGYHYPLGSDEGPTVECSLNAAEFWPGDQLTAEYGIDNAGPDITIDVYFAFVMPDGAILCISPERIDFGIFPCMTDFFLKQGYSMDRETLIDLAVPGGLPAGGYLFAGALSTPGAFEVIGDLSLFSFTIAH